MEIFDNDQLSMRYHNSW